MQSDTSSRRGRVIAAAAAAQRRAGGLTAAGLGLSAGALPPGGSAVSTAAPATPSTGATAAPTSDPAATTSGTTTPAPPAAADASPAAAADTALPASVPGTVTIPSIGVSSNLLQLGKQANGEVETPPGEPGSPAGWYKNSPTPGQNGSAIILGHVNSTKGPVGVFYRLHELTPGQTFSVTRADRTEAIFTVDKVDTYRKANFPTVDVYKNADRPEIRLITCGGYDPATGEYLDNTVVYAHLTSSRPA